VTYLLSAKCSPQCHTEYLSPPVVCPQKLTVLTSITDNIHYYQCHISSVSTVFTNFTHNICHHQCPYIYIYIYISNASIAKLYGHITFVVLWTLVMVIRSVTSWRSCSCGAKCPLPCSVPYLKDPQIFLVGQRVERYSVLRSRGSSQSS